MPRTSKGHGIRVGVPGRTKIRIEESEVFRIEDESLNGLAAKAPSWLDVRLSGPVASYALLGLLSILAMATVLLGRLIPPLGDALHQVALFLVR